MGARGGASGGPERVFGEWWKRDAELIALRDYFQVADDAGERFWIFRAGDGQDAASGSHAPDLRMRGMASSRSQHPASFLRSDLVRSRIVTYVEALNARDLA